MPLYVAQDHVTYISALVDLAKKKVGGFGRWFGRLKGREVDVSSRLLLQQEPIIIIVCVWLVLGEATKSLR